MNRPKYAIHPGYIISSHDGEVHYIGVAQLVKCYGLKVGDFIVIDDKHPESKEGLNMDDYIHLYPRADGKYELPVVND